MKNTDLGSPSDEYILNNPWTYGMDTLGGNVMPGDVRAGKSPVSDPMFLSVTGNTGAGKHEGAGYQTALTNFNRPRIAENASIATDMEQIYSPEGLANLYPVDPEQMYSPGNVERLSAPLPAYLANPQPRTSGNGSNFLNFLNRATAAIGSDSSRPGFFANPAEYVGNKISDTYNDLRNIGNWTTGEFVNAGLNALPTGLPGIVGGVLAGGLNVPLAKGNSFVTSPPLSYGLGQDFREFIQNLGKPKGKAAGGVNLEDGSFVVDARTVAELGNGSSGAGQEVLARLGGRPIKGPGDGVSDSIRANIGGKQEARVARDEVKFSPEAVKRVGGGNPKKGADRLYAMMKKAEKARKTASRGKDTGLRALVGEK
jgi:hypothetical protein